MSRGSPPGGPNRLILPLSLAYAGVGPQATELPRVMRPVCLPTLPDLPAACAPIRCRRS